MLYRYVALYSFLTEAVLFDGSVIWTENGLLIKKQSVKGSDQND